jgi:hypothetical protein
MTIDPTRRPALCCECGAVRTVSAHCLMDRELRCAACKTTRMHAVLGYGLIEDWRERNDHRGSLELTEEEELDRLREMLELGNYDATAFETPAEQQERIAKTRLHGEARTQQFIELHRQGLGLHEIAWETDWSSEVVRQALRKAGVTEFNNRRAKPGLSWEQSDDRPS